MDVAGSLYWEITRWAVSGCCWFPFTGRLLGGMDVAGYLYWEITRWAVSGCCWLPSLGDY